jgi:3-(3-hydroxy-phenyl)propionate hydroxylase
MLPQPMVTTGSGATAKLDGVLGTGFALLAIGDDAAAALAVLDQPIWAHLDAERVASLPIDGGQRHGLTENRLRVAQITAEAMPRKREPYRGKILLIRPDRYVAVACSPTGVTDIGDALSGLIRTAPGNDAALR